MKNLMRVALAVVVVVCVCNLDSSEVVWRVNAQAADAREPLFPAAFVFGDSLVDVGNNNYVPLALAKANLPPNGIDFPTGRPTGRFCNGKTTADVLCKQFTTPAPLLTPLFCRSSELIFCSSIVDTTDLCSVIDLL
jgi:hypothetical protein